MQQDGSNEGGYCVASMQACQWECLSPAGFLAASGQTMPQACASAGVASS